MSHARYLTCLDRRFGYVDFSSEEELQKGLALNGTKLMGQELKMDRARSKEGAQDGKKGKGCVTSTGTGMRTTHPPFLGTLVVVQYSCV